MSNPKVIIEKLIQSGMKECQITDELRKSGVEVTKATINRIKTGCIKRTGFDIGIGLVRLYESRVPQSRVQR